MAEQVKYVDSFHVLIGSNTSLTVKPVKISVLIMAVNSLCFLGYMSDDPHDLYRGQRVMSLQNLFSVCFSQWPPTMPASTKGKGAQSQACYSSELSPHVSRCSVNHESERIPSIIMTMYSKVDWGKGLWVLWSWWYSMVRQGKFSPTHEKPPETGYQ